VIHFINIFGIILILPFLSIGINIFINSRKNIQQNTIELVLGWLIFWSLGIRTFSVGLMQTINPIYTSNLLQLELNDFIIIREHGLNNIGIGFLCIISFFRHFLRKYSCMIILISYTGFSILHITRIETINFEEIISLIIDLIIIIISLCSIVYYTKIKYNQQHQGMNSYEL